MRRGFAMTDQYLNLRQICRRASICERTLRRYLPEIPHSRSGPRGKIRINWVDFKRWMKSRQVEIGKDDLVTEILREMHASTHASRVN
jgi:hypothetical protein